MIAAVGMFANALLGRVEVGHDFGEAAMDLASRAAFHTSRHLVLQVHEAALHNAEQAAEIWRNWGADALVENLGERWPELSTPVDSTRE